MERVRAKFQVLEVGRRAWGGQVVRAQAVYGGGEENRSFAAATPQGSFEIVVDNPAVEGFFEPGSEVYVTFEQAPKPAEG